MDAYYGILEVNCDINNHSNIVIMETGYPTLTNKYYKLRKKVKIYNELGRDNKIINSGKNPNENIKIDK